MLRYRRWAIVGALALAQIGIIVCYAGILRGNSAAAAAGGTQEKTCPPAASATPDREDKGTDRAAGPCPAVAGRPVPGESLLLVQAPALPEPKASAPPPAAAAEKSADKAEPFAVPPPLPAATGDGKKDDAPDKSPPASAPEVGKSAAAESVPPPPLPGPAPAPTPGASLLKPTEPPAPATPAPPSPAPVIDKADGPAAPPPLPAAEKHEAPPAPTAPVAPPPPPTEKAPAIPEPPAPPATGSVPAPVPSDAGTATAPPPPPVPSSGEGRLVPMTAPAADATPPAACPWILRMEIVKGRTQLEARIGKEVQFRVTCSQLSIEAPRGCLNAKGEVKITGSELDGTCEGLTINWQDDHVFLEGKAHLKCLRNGQDVDLNAERLSLKLSTSSSVKGVGSRRRVETEEPPTEADDTDLK